MAAMAMEGSLRIGELSRRSGVSPELLRAWERRYGLLRPTRSAGGLRLYSGEDVERVNAMRRHIDDGLAAAEAAALALRTAAVPAPQSLAFDPARTRVELGAALDAFDEAEAQAVLDRALAATTLDGLLAEIVLPYLRDLGARWERGEVSVAQEHFASGVLRGRLLGLARGWGLGAGPVAVLACLPGEHHDLGLIAFGLALRARGWRIVYLGPDTPIDTVGSAADGFPAPLVVLQAVDGDRLRPAVRALRSLAARHRVVLGGGAVRGGVEVPADVRVLTGDPVSEAAALAA